MSQNDQLPTMKSVYIIFAFLILFLWSGCQQVVAQKNSESNRIDSLLKEGKDKFQDANFSKAQKIFLEALSYAEKKKDIHRQIEASENVALCHYYLRDKDMALKWLHRSLKMSKAQQSDSLTAYINYYIGVMYVELNVKDSAEFYTYPAIHYWKTTKNYKSISKVYSILSELYIWADKKDNQKTEEILGQAEKYAVLSKDKGTIGFAAMKYHMYYYSLKDYPKALKYINQVEGANQDSKFAEDLMYAYRFKAVCLSKMGDTTASDYMIKWFEFKDSIFNVEKAKELSKYETLYETHQKEQKITEQKLQILSEKNKKIIYSSISLLLLIIGFIAFIYLRKKQKDKTMLLLQEQHEKSIREIFEAEQKERIRIARDLHDSIGQKLAVMRMLLPSKDEFPDIKKVTNYLDEITSEVRNISHNLIPEILNFGLVKALESLATRINSTKHIQVHFVADKKIDDLELPKQTELSLYRIIQEITSNIVRHSQTKNLTLELIHLSESIQITITDEGIGFDNEAIDESTGLGWKNIFARIKLANGKIKIHSEKDKGSQFMINIPII